MKTLSGDDVPSVDILDKQISDFDSHTRTWGRREVIIRTNRLRLLLLGPSDVRKTLN